MFGVGHMLKMYALSGQKREALIYVKVLELSVSVKASRLLKVVKIVVYF